MTEENKELRIKKAGTIPIRSFTQLEAWKIAHVLTLLIYKITKLFPQDEIFALTSQMRRCGVSVASNIAEGFSRQSYKEKIQFYSVAKGSLTEPQSQLLIARDIGYINSKTFTEVADKTVSAHKMLTGLIKSSKLRSLHS